MSENEFHDVPNVSLLTIRENIENELERRGVGVPDTRPPAIDRDAGEIATILDECEPILTHGFARFKADAMDRIGDAAVAGVYHSDHAAAIQELQEALEGLTRELVTTNDTPIAIQNALNAARAALAKGEAK